MHVGIPCSTWSLLARMNGSSRSAACPDGARPFTRKDAESWTLADRTASLCLALHVVGGIYTIENPAESLVFVCSPFTALKQAAPWIEVQFDQCCYGLRPPSAAPGEFIRKRTKLVTNHDAFQQLARACPGISKHHQHVHALGSRKEPGPSGLRTVSVAFSAGRYPSALCEALASIVMTTTTPITTPARTQVPPDTPRRAR